MTVGFTDFEVLDLTDLDWEFEQPCEPKLQCDDAAATWHRLYVHDCGQVHDQMVCDACKKWFERTSTWVCEGCHGYLGNTLEQYQKFTPIKESS